LNVHSLEDDLAIYLGLVEEVANLLIAKGAGIFQIPCPEMEVFGIFRKPLPREPYESPKIRGSYRRLAETIAKRLLWFVKKGYKIVAVLGADGSPTCGINLVGRWKDPSKKGRFPEDVAFVEGMGIFMEGLKKILEENGIQTNWIGIPGKSIRTLNPASFEKALEKIEAIL
jgi:predicted secreted protein